MRAADRRLTPPRSTGPLMELLDTPSKQEPSQTQVDEHDQNEGEDQ